MAKESVGLLKPTPLVTALARHAEAGGIARLSGFVGPSEPNLVRLYQNLELTSFLELPRSAILHSEKAKNGRDGEVEIFVAESTKVTATYRSSTSVTAGEHVRGEPLVVFQQKGTGPTPDERCRRANSNIDTINEMLYDEMFDSNGNPKADPDQSAISGLLHLRNQQRELRTKYCSVVAL